MASYTHVVVWGRRERAVRRTPEAGFSVGELCYLWRRGLVRRQSVRRTHQLRRIHSRR